MRRRLTALARHAHPARPLPVYRLLRDSQWWSPGELEGFRTEALRTLIAAAVTVPFWRRRLAGAGLAPGEVASLDDLAALPPLDRADVQREGIRGLSVAGRRGTVVSTSGSSGRPVRFLRPLELVRWITAADLRAREWYGVGQGEPRLDIPGRKPTLQYRLYAAASNLRLLNALDDRGVARLARRLERRPPAMVAGTAGGLYLLALALDRLGRSVRPRAVWSGGSMLFDHQRRAVEAAFGCRASSRYAAWEPGVIAHECPEAGALHVFAENVVLEVVRPDGTQAGPGEVGEVLVTALHNTAMPLVRYRMGDLASIATESCSCGRSLPVLERLVGRSDELIVRVDGTPVLPNRVGSDIMAGARTVVEFQVVQHGDLRIRAQVVQEGSPEEAAVERERVARQLDELIGLPDATTVEPVTAIAPGPGGKLRHIVSRAASNVDGADVHGAR
jgi:phenylacetate-CoA ligase